MIGPSRREGPAVGFGPPNLVNKIESIIQLNIMDPFQRVYDTLVSVVQSSDSYAFQNYVATHNVATLVRKYKRFWLTFLELACDYGRSDIARQIIKRYHKYLDLETAVDVVCRTRTGIDLIELLVYHGADPYDADLFISACISDQCHIVEYFLKLTHGKCNVEPGILYACRHGALSVIVLLLGRYYNDGLVRSGFSAACRTSEIDVVRYFLKNHYECIRDMIAQESEYAQKHDAPDIAEVLIGY
jgi:hypothetical protein